MNKIIQKIYEKPALPFLEIFVWIYFIYLSIRFITFDPTPYAHLSSLLWKAPGLLNFFDFPEFQLWHFQVARGIGVITAFLAAAGVFYNVSAFICLAAWSVIEVGQNGFGFVNVEIHLFWIGLALSFCPLNRHQRGKDFYSDTASWTVIFIQLVIVLVYIQSGFAKIYTSGWSWVSEGTTFQIALLRQGVPLGVFLSRFEIFAKTMAFASVVFEFSFLLYPFLPKVRIPLLCISLLFHFGTQILLGISFHHLWISSLSLLLFGRGLIAPLSSKQTRGLLIVDGSCALCNRFSRFLFASLWRRRFQITSFGSKTALSVGINIENSKYVNALIWIPIIDTKANSKEGHEAVLEALKDCGPVGLFIHCTALFLPKRFKAIIYSMIATKRYHFQLNGTHLEKCDVLTMKKLSEFS